MEDAPNKEWNMWLTSFPDRTLCDARLASSKVTTSEVAAWLLTWETALIMCQLLITQKPELHLSCTRMSRKVAETQSTNLEAKLGLVPSNILCFYCQACVKHHLSSLSKWDKAPGAKPCSHNQALPLHNNNNTLLQANMLHLSTESMLHLYRTDLLHPCIYHNHASTTTTLQKWITFSMLSWKFCIETEDTYSIQGLSRPGIGNYWTVLLIRCYWDITHVCY